MLTRQIAWIWVQIWVRVGIAYFLIASLCSFFLAFWDVLTSPPAD